MKSIEPARPLAAPRQIGQSADPALSPHPDQRHGEMRQQNRGGRKRNARLIAISGVDCSGKTTQISLLMSKLRDKGEKPTYFWSRVGYTPLFNALRTLLRRIAGEARLPKGDSPKRDRFLARPGTRRLWLWVAFADMMLQTALHLRLLLLKGHTIVCDRYLDDSESDLIINFGASVARLPGWRLVRAMAPTPDVSILLDLPFEEALRRSILKNEPFPDPEERRLRRSFLYQTMRQRNHHTVLDARKGIDEIAAEIDSLVFADESAQ